ncbi:histone-arginine methyltransferase METTL23-like isoform X2 [Betta splendens]|uniref:Histone-arginine methyltransferase METTL23-like isoform X2 n=1 Tax=Betta splendens TaxID=158456 RepID=A0A6P7NCE2_BETSP|nr:histone-arginine methyltransferase METTL23-like isoform X2 [Betta splendens]
MMDDKGTETLFVARRVFTFEENKKNTENAEESLIVSIPEVLDPQYGMYVWPCAVVLAQYLWTQREKLRDKTVLELGAGVSLPGVVAAKCGAKVILSDSAKTPRCLENCRHSCEANGLHDVSVMDLTWGEISPDVIRLPKLDIILGSDVFYDPQGKTPKPSSGPLTKKEVLTGPLKCCSTDGSLAVLKFSWTHLMPIKVSWLDQLCLAATSSK